jgi:phage-related protein
MKGQYWEFIDYYTYRTDGTRDYVFENELIGLGEKVVVQIMKKLTIYSNVKILQRPYFAFVEDEIFELRPKPFRILIAKAGSNRFIMLHILEKKTDEIPERNKEIAKNRLRDYKLRTNTTRGNVS